MSKFSIPEVAAMNRPAGGAGNPIRIMLRDLEPGHGYPLEDLFLTWLYSVCETFTPRSLPISWYRAAFADVLKVELEFKPVILVEKTPLFGVMHAESTDDEADFERSRLAKIEMLAALRGERVFTG